MLQPDPKKSKMVEKKTTVTAKPKMVAKKPKTVSQRIGDITLRDVKNATEDGLNIATLGGYKVAKKKIKEVTGLKNGGNMKNNVKMKMGGEMKTSQNGLRDIPAGNKGLPKLEKVVRNKMGFKKNGGMMAKSGAAMKKQAAVAIAMKKAGKTPMKKAMNGYGGKAASMAPKAKNGMHMMNGKMMKDSEMKSGGMMKMGGKMKKKCDSCK